MTHLVAGDIVVPYDPETRGWVGTRKMRILQISDDGAHATLKHEDGLVSSSKFKMETIHLCLAVEAEFIKAKIRRTLRHAQ